MKIKAATFGLVVLVGITIMTLFSYVLAEESGIASTYSEPLTQSACESNTHAGIKCSCGAHETRLQKRICNCVTEPELDMPDDTNIDSSDSEVRGGEDAEPVPCMQVFGSTTTQSAFAQEVKHLQIYLNAYIRQQASNISWSDFPYLVKMGFLMLPQNKPCGNFRLISVSQKLALSGMKQKPGSLT